MLFVARTEFGAIETRTDPLLLKLPLRLNRTVWSSIQVRLVALTGESELMPVPVN